MKSKTERPNQDDSAQVARRNDITIDSLAYMRPTYLAPSAWLEHVPFAFWLTNALRPSTFVELGTHWGASYFAFCQAFDSLNLGGRSFAVDSWQGEEHSGTYGPEVFNAVKAYNDRHYRHFSTLIKSDFDDARGYFLDGSIDLLHIDGLHTYEAVRHDFETWLPLMSPRGAVVLHDTNVREGNFGVFSFFAELKASYPTFEFFHGHGLGIVGVGDQIPSRLKELFNADADTQRGLHRVFSFLGRACGDANLVQETQRQLEGVKEAEAAKHLEALQKTERRAAAAVAELEQIQTQSRDNSSALDDLRGRLAQTESALAQRQLESEQSFTELAEAKRELMHLNQERGERYQVINELTQQVSQLGTELRERQQAEREVRATNVVLAASLKEAEVRTKDRFDEIAVLTSLVMQRNSESQNLASEMEGLNSALAQAHERVAASSGQLAAIEYRYAASEAAADQMKQQLWAAISAVIEAKSGSVLPSGLQLWRKVKRLEQSGLFDAGWYASQYPDVVRDGINPARHFVQYGYREGRAPCPALAKIEGD